MDPEIDKPRILLVDDVPGNITLLAETLSVDYELTIATSGHEAIEAMVMERPDMVLLDVAMPGMDGYETCRRIKADPDACGIPIIFITAKNREADEASGLEAGTIDYITKPFSIPLVMARIRNHLEHVRAEEEVRILDRQNRQFRSLLVTGPEQDPAFAAIITRSKKMVALFKYLSAAAVSGDPILITGETGVGKELLVEAVHKLSGREGPLVPVNAAAIDDNMFSDTLFGHVKGAFSGALSTRSGMIAHAADGTLFLDEIGDLEPASQIKLLRLLQDRKYVPLGSDQYLKTDARIVCATNRDLDVLMKKGQFRPDLFYRLAAHRIHTPPLRERKEDIPLLLRHFLSEQAKALQKPAPTPPPELDKLLCAYAFPGNIRELQSLVGEAVTQHKSGVLSMASFKKVILEDPSDEESQEYSSKKQLADLLQAMPDPMPTIKDMTTELIAEVMRRSGGNQRIASALLGISRHTLMRRLQEPNP